MASEHVYDPDAVKEARRIHREMWRGVYRKFKIERTDGKGAPGEKHDGCHYFVLDLTHDPFAIPALRAYAEACRTKRPQLAHDLWATVGRDGYPDDIDHAAFQEMLESEEPKDG